MSSDTPLSLGYCDYLFDAGMTRTKQFQDINESNEPGKFDL